MKNHLRNSALTRFILLVFSGLLLTGCGGGGSSSTPLPVDTSIPSLTIVSVSGVGNQISVTYNLYDDDSEQVSVLVEYLENSDWKSATATSNTSQTPGEGKTLVWKSGTDKFYLPEGMTTRLRLTPFNNKTGESKETEYFFFSTHGLESSTLWTGTSEAFHWSLADLDSDGDLDGILTPSEATVAPCETAQNNGNATFTRSDIAGSTPLSLATNQSFDYDGDSDMDIITIGQNGTKFTSVLANNGSGSFADTGMSLEGFSRPSSCFGDINRDGFVDMVCSGINLNTRDIITFFGANTGGFTFNERLLSESGSTISVAPGDVDNNGTLDLVIAGVRLYIYSNDGSGNFTLTQTINISSDDGNVALADLNCDGALDIGICGAASAGAQILLNYGNGTFPSAGGSTIYNLDGQLTFGDITGDGYPDMILTGNNSGTLYTKLYINDKHGGFSESLQQLNPSTKASICIGDLDGDNDLDILTNGSTGSSWTTVLYRNSSAGPNSLPEQPSEMNATYTGSGPYEVTFTFNDGKDEETPTKGLSYDIRIGSSTGTHNRLSGHHKADGTRLLPHRGMIQPQLEGENFHKVTLPSGTWYWTIQTIDASFEGSTVINEQVLTLP